MVKSLLASIAVLISTASLASAQTLPSSFVPPVIPHAATVAMPRLEAPAKRTPWAFTALAVAGPLADGISTYWAIKQSGPIARVAEGNAFFHHLFGSNVTPGEILAFKIVQATVMGLNAHYTPPNRRERAIFAAVSSAVIFGVVSTMNVRGGLAARRLNATATITWGPGEH